MFEGFVRERIEGDGATLFVRRAGPQDAPPLVLLHGYPQTSAMWHGVGTNSGTLLSNRLSRFTRIWSIR